MLYLAVLPIYLFAVYILGRVFGRATGWLESISVWLPIVAVLSVFGVLAFPGLLILGFVVDRIPLSGEFAWIRRVLFFGSLLGQIFLLQRGMEAEVRPRHAGG